MCHHVTQFVSLQNLLFKLFKINVRSKIYRNLFVYLYIFPFSNCDPKQYVSSHIMRPITTLPSWFWKTLKADRNAASGRAEVIRPRCFVLSEPQMVLEVMKRFMVSYRLVGVEGGVIWWSVGENTLVLREWQGNMGCWRPAFYCFHINLHFIHLNDKTKNLFVKTFSLSI